MKEETKQQFQHTVTRSFQLHKNRTVYSDEEAAAELKGKKSVGRSIHTTSFSYNLPYNLTDEWMGRHQPSRSDYVKILQCTDVKHLWMMTALHGIKIYTSVDKIGKSADGQPTFTYSGNTQFRKKIEDFIVESGKLSPVSKMIARGDTHKPPLMLQFISQETLDSIPPPRKFHNYCFSWGGAHIVPSEYYNGYYKMNVVLPMSIYRARNPKPENLISHPDEFLIDGIVCCGTKEYFLFQTKANHEAIMAVASSRDLREFDNALFRIPRSSSPDVDRHLLTSVGNTTKTNSTTKGGKRKAEK